MSVKQQGAWAALLAAGFGLATVSPAGAAILDLTTAGASGSVGAGYYEQISPGSTGTGVIDSFVRIQHNGNEDGFNTDARPLGPDLSDVNNSTQYTHSVPVGALEVTDRSGTASVQFLLDINQTGANPLISLDELKVYVAASPSINDFNTLATTGTLLYDLGAGNKIFLDFSLNSGSGSGDMFFYLPASLFYGHANQYLYLYSKFGYTGGDYKSNDGFEEWARVGMGLPTPVRATTWGSIKKLF